MRTRRGTVGVLLAAIFWWMGGALHTVAGQSQGAGEVSTVVLASDNPPVPAEAAAPAPPPAAVPKSTTC